MSVFICYLIFYFSLTHWHDNTIGWAKGSAFSLV